MHQQAFIPYPLLGGKESENLSNSSFRKERQTGNIFICVCVCVCVCVSE